MAITASKLQRRFYLIFIVIALSTLVVDDPEKVYSDETICKSYRNQVLKLTILYHTGLIIISLITSDWTNIYIFPFCFTFGIFQTFVADNYLCTHHFMEYPLNIHPFSDSLGYCIPEYMIFSWSMFAIIVLQFSLWFNTLRTHDKSTNTIGIIISSLFGFIFIVLMEIATDLPQLSVVALWKANTKNPKIDLMYGGFASYLIVPELGLSIAISIVYYFFVQPSIDNYIINKNYPSMFKYLSISTILPLVITILYVALLNVSQDFNI